MRNSNVSIAGVYVGSVAGILLSTALAKLFSAFGSAEILLSPDPLLPVNNRQLLVLVAVVELVVMAYLMLGRDVQIKQLSIVSLGTTFILYRLAIWWMEPTKPCSCLGTITERLALQPETLDFALKLIIVYMVIGSMCFLVFQWLRTRKNKFVEGSGSLLNT